MADKTGQQVGSYRLVRLLGKGGFAEVYLGQHVRVASKKAAVKILYLYDVDAQKFHEEAEVTEQLVHPHIVRLLDYDLQEGTPFLVLDYAPGGTLRNRHPKGSQVPLDIVVAYLKEIAPALQYAHDRHILHRDIKPDNMLIGRQGELLLSDFGIAQLSQTGRSSIEASFVTGGTPFYMAPEMFRGKPEKASDQYSLAVVVYEWLCGAVPFSGGNFIQLGYQHTHEPVPPLRDKNPAIPFAIEQVILKALAKVPKDRYPEVKDFAEDMESASIATQRKEPPLKPIPSSTVPPVVAPVSTETRGSATSSGSHGKRKSCASDLQPAPFVLIV
jgi:eukaryotic-like serine/threonine-protein kinase